MAASWPSIATPDVFREKIIKRVIHVETEAGYVASRAIGTAYKKQFTLGWRGMSYSDKSSLQTFFDNNQGDGFDYTSDDENDGSTYTCIFLDDEIEWEYNKSDPSRPYACELTIREV